MKKILLVAADGFSKTGVPFVFMNIVRNLSKEGYIFDIIYFDERFKYYYDEFCSYGGNAFLLNKQFKSSFFRKIIRYVSSGYYYKKTLKILKEHGPYDAIHCFNEYRSCSFLKAAKKHGVLLRIYHCNNVISISGNIINRLLMKKEKRQCLKYATTFIGCSKKAIKSAFDNINNPLIINNPYDDKIFKFTDKAVFCKEKLRLVQTSGFCDNKNQLFSLEIVSELAKKIPNIEMNFIGMNINENYRKKLEKRIYELKLNNKIVFYNFDVEQKPIFDTCNYFLLPSKSEAFGIVLIEAQACGLKCFASDRTPIEVNVGGCVRLSLSKTPSEWAELIYNDFISTTEKRFYNCSSYQNTNIIKKYVELYELGGCTK